MVVLVGERPKHEPEKTAWDFPFFRGLSLVLVARKLKNSVAATLSGVPGPRR